jgi:DNA-binding NtrC family response regulator
LDKPERTERQEDSALSERDGSVPSAHLRFVLGQAPQEAYELGAAGVTLGRLSEPALADLVFPDSRVSRKHARVERGASSWRYVDLGSSNGGFVDGRAVGPGQQAPLVDGALLRLGNTLAVFRTSPLAGLVDGAAGDDSFFPGASPPAVDARRRLRRLAAGTGHVLLLGETGVGKERAARALASPERPFVVQNCAELTRELARSELFGHTRGAFSGAHAAKPGLVDVAGGGTLFLDEIGELPLDVQGELLRFLEDGSYHPIGSPDVRTSRARVVAATNVDLVLAVRDNKFRRDLLARLRASNLPVELPPLRDRREDILSWAGHFLREVGVDRPDEAWSAGAAECLLLYPWPENLRELRGIVRTLAAERTGWPLEQGALPERVRAHRRSLRSALEGTSHHVVERPAGKAANLTKAELEAVLERVGGRVRAAAQELGVERRQVYRLCERLGIDIECYRNEPKTEVS